MRKLLLLIVAIVMVQDTLKANDVWIYSDDGAWLDGIIAIEQFLNYRGITHRRVYAPDLNNSNNYSSAKAICFPGGYSYNYKVALADSTINNIREYVANGGNYLGICAGAFFACSNVAWEGKNYSYKLSLFNGSAIGPIDSIAIWDSYAMTDITLNSRNPILKNSPSKLSTLYYGGPYFVSNKTAFDTLATYDFANDMPAIINFYYQNGKVLLIGPHLEIEENSNRDSTAFANELNDVESDWETLSNMTQWLIGGETSIKELRNDSENKNFQVYSNPSNTVLSINNKSIQILRFHILNSLGQIIESHVLQSNSIDISKLQTGLYFIKLIDVNGCVFVSKFYKY